MATIRWLHLTDLHCGIAGQNWLWPTLRTAFFEDLKRLRDKADAPWDLVLFTGDLTQAGSPRQFAALNEILQDLWKHLDPNTKLLAVPGNHDLQRPPPKSSVVKALGQWWNDPDIPAEFWASTTNDYREAAIKAFASFADWRDKHPFHVRIPETSALPGDFAWTFEKHGFKLGIVGLNSAFLQLTDTDYEGKLAIDRQQLHSVCGGDAPTWLTKHHVSLLLTHHPSDWFNPRAREEFQREILGRDHFFAHLHGHLHVPAGQSRRDGGGPTRLTLQGASLFGLESYGKLNDKRRIHGYSAGELSITSDAVSMRIWPRIAILTQGGYDKLVADQSFDLDESESYTCTMPLALAGGASPPPPTLVVIPSWPSAKAIDAYRQRLSTNFERWDLQSIGIAQPGGASQPVAPQIDDMYVQLRFAETYNPDNFARGQPLAAADLLKLEHPIVIRGAAGAGKTTWSRVVFRELLRRPDAVPLMIVLRDLARRWSQPDCTDEARSLDAHLDGTLREHVPAADRGSLSEWLVDPRAPRPVLLVDGWDEVGPLADELRLKLSGFLKQYPRVLAVVTSRPYGEGQPTTSEQFRVLDIQPLSNDDIHSLATRFFKFCYGDDPDPVADRVERFMSAVAKAPEPLRLARTPLLLTMMLFISRSGPLPDKRHRLYQACIDNLLSALPGQKEEEGALHPRRHWRPSDAEDRMRIVAALAHAVHQKTQKDSSARSSIIATIDELAGWMPADWPREGYPGMTRTAQRTGFIYWLAGPAGVLTERADGTFSFTHLSFQEYLTAWHLNATIEGDARNELFLAQCEDAAWFEVLRLWGAIIAAQSEDRIRLVSQALCKDPERGLCAAGMLFADGVPSQGPADGFEAWVSSFVSRLRKLPPARHVHAVVEAWNASQQEARKSALKSELETAGALLNLGQWVYVNKNVSRLTRIAVPNDQDVQSVVTWSETAGVATARDVAVLRVLTAASSLWPGTGALSLLQVWPTARRLAGIRAQIAILCGAERTAIVREAKRLLAPYLFTGEGALPEDRLFSRLISGGAANQDLIRLGFRSALIWATNHVPPMDNLAINLEGPSSMRVFLSIGFKHGARRVQFIKGVGVSFGDGHLLENGSLHWGAAYDTSYNLDGTDVFSSPQWIRDSSALDVTSATAYGAWFALAVRPERDDISALMRAACRLWLRPKVSDAERRFDECLRMCADKQLWCSLARHIAGRSTTDDRAYLEDAVVHAERFPEPLSWGLRHIVRGDAVLRDGSILSLDDISDAAGLPHLPFLETMPKLKQSSSDTGKRAERTATWEWEGNGIF